MSEKIKVKSINELSNIQKIVSARMSKASSIPQLLQNIKADTTDLLNIKKELQEKLLLTDSVKITYTDFLIKIIAFALREDIGLNSTYDNDKHIIYDDINIGLAISVGNDLVVATIYNADKLSITEIANKRIELLKKAERQQLSLSDVKYSTFTITNIGTYGIRSSYAIINPPQAAILALGQIYKEPAISDGDIVPRSFIELNLSVDHRIINGALSAKFLHNVASIIENPTAVVKT